MKAHFTILADDLSGAADCAVPFARAGFFTEIFLHPEIFARTNPAVGARAQNTALQPQRLTTTPAISGPSAEPSPNIIVFFWPT